MMFASLAILLRHFGWVCAAVEFTLKGKRISNIYNTVSVR